MAPRRQEPGADRMSMDAMVVDDEGLIALLKLPAGTDLRRYRNDDHLPYVKFKIDGQVHHRYIVSEVLQWLRDRQYHGRTVRA
jgi:hypothetical protein